MSTDATAVPVAGGPQQRKKDAKAEDPEATDCWEDIERSMTMSCVLATVSGMLLFTVLAALAFNQVGRPVPVGVFTGRTHKGRLPPNTLDPAKTVQVNPDQPVASWVSPHFLPDVLEVDDAKLLAGELYGAGRAQLHRVDTLKDFQSDVLRTHGKMMAVRSTGLQDTGPFLAHINGPTFTNGRGASGQEVPTATRLAYDPEGVLLMVFATLSGNLYGTRIRTGLNPGASEGWERGSQWSEPIAIVEQRSGNIHYRVQDPVLFHDPHANAFRIVYTGYIDAKQYYLYMISSADQGASWTWPEQLYIHPGVRSFGNVLRPTSQDYVLPIQREPNVGSGWKTVSALLSDDHAVSFREVEIQSVSEPNYVGPAMVQLRDGSLAVYLAPESSDTLRMKVSKDGGKTWGESIRTDIPNSGIAHHSATVLRSGLVAIMFVNHFKAPGKSIKSPLSIAVSLDAHGKVFAHVRDIELADAHELGGLDVEASRMPGFDHPTLLQTPNGLLHIAYPCTRHLHRGKKKGAPATSQHFIKYVALDEEWLARGSSLPSRGVYQGLSDPAWRHS